MVRVWLTALAVTVAGLGQVSVRAGSIDAWGVTAMLEGQWREVRGTAVIEETWTNNNGNVVVGMSRTVDGLSNAFEFMRIENRKEGIVFIAQPGGDKPTTFRLTMHDATTLVFTNPAHDFPQRIEYRRRGADTLEATVGMLDGEGKRLVYRYVRVK